MLKLRARLSAVALVGALVASSGTLIVVADTPHTVCTPKQHACGRTASLARCCCPGNQDATDQAGTIESAVQLSPDIVAVPAAIAPSALAPAATISVDPDRSPPRAAPPDRLSLFSTLVI